MEWKDMWPEGGFDVRGMVPTNGDRREIIEMRKQL